MRRFIEDVCPRDVVARCVDEARGTCVVETTGPRRAARVSRALAATTERERRARVARALGVRIRTVEDVSSAVREEIARALDAGAEPPPRSHPNVASAHVVVFERAGSAVVSLEPVSEYTLGQCMRLGSDALQAPERRSLAAYQACRALAHVHEKNLAHGNLSADSVRLSALSGGPVGVPYVQLVGMFDSSHVRDGSTGETGSRRVEVSEESAQRLREGAETSVRSLTAAWRVGAVSNLEYVEKLNDIARRGTDLAYYRVAPWVIDFTAFPLRDDGSLRGARDLTRTKWRLTKGDEQLDFTYRHTTPPHHVSDDCLSELGACVALARRTPRSTLARIVRANVVAEEYPKRLERLYEMSPDEAPIDFYTNPRVFSSIHEDMEDLRLPSWCDVGEDAATYFIKIHRKAFESRAVSERLHAWIDLTFGYATCGTAAVEAKNVMVRDDVEGMMRSSGRCRIFHAPHPKRRVGVVPRAPPDVDVVVDRDADDASTTEALRTTTIVEPAFRFVQERDLRALGRIIGAIYAGVPCPEEDREASAGGLFDDDSISNSLFDRRRENEGANASLKAWLARMPSEARDVVKLMMDVTKPIAAAAVRDSVLFSQDVRNAARALGNMRATEDSRAEKIMIAEDALTGASAITARLVLEDVCPAIAAYFSAPLDETEEMRVAMCLARFVVTACDVASRRDASEMILPLVVSAVNAPSAHFEAEGPTLKRELFELAVVDAMRKAVGAARFDDVFVPTLIKCLQPKFCNADELRRVKDALVHIATSMPLPVVRQRVVRVLRRALRNNRDDTASGAHVLIADVLSLLARALGPASEEFIFRATTAASPTVLDHLDDWHRRAGAEPVERREWYWLSRASRDEDEHELEDASTMSQVLANASNVTGDPWRVHVEELVSWRAHSRVARRCAQSLSVSVDERLFMTAGRTSRGEGTVRIWRASGPEDDTNRAMVSYDGHGAARVTASAFLDFATDADGFVSRACSCDDRGTLQVWDTRGDHVWRIFARDSNGFESLCVDDGGRGGGPFIVGGTARGRVLIADAVTGKVRGEYSSPRDVSHEGDDGVCALHSAADGVIWASNARGFMRGFDIRAKRDRPVYDVKAHDDAVNKIVSTPKSERELLTASDDMTIGLWDVRMMRVERDSRKRFDARVHTFRGHQKGVKDACVSSVGDVFSVSGCSVGVFSLASSGASHFARFSPLSVHGATTRLLPTSIHEQASFGAIRLLPKSRLFALLNDDGAVSVCH